MTFFTFYCKNCDEPPHFKLGLMQAHDVEFIPVFRTLLDAEVELSNWTEADGPKPEIVEATLSL